MKYCVNQYNGAPKVNGGTLRSRKIPGNRNTTPKEERVLHYFSNMVIPSGITNEPLIGVLGVAFLPEGRIGGGTGHRYFFFANLYSPTRTGFTFL